jgi:hypothetical protein
VIEFWNTAELPTATSTTTVTKKRSAQKGGLTPLQSAKEACAKAIRINGSLRMVGKTEIIYCLPSCAFFKDRPELIKARDEVFKMFEKTQNLRWILPVTQLENLSSMLPKDWNTIRWNNVCFCIGVESDAEKAAASFELFRKIPVSLRMIYVGPLSRPLDLAGKLRDINWLMHDGGPLPPDPENDPSIDWSRALRDASEQGGAAFFYHRAGVASGLDGREWRNHPFGDKVDLTRPALPNSEKILAFVPTGTAAPDLPAESSGNSEPAAAATVTATVPTNAETPELVTTDASGNPVKLEPTPAVFSPEENVSTMPETPAAATQANPKQPGRVRKTKQQIGEETTSNADTPNDPPDGPEPALEIVVTGRVDNDSGPNPTAEVVDVEVMPAGKSSGKTKSKGEGLVVQNRLENFKHCDCTIRRVTEEWPEFGKALKTMRDDELWREGGFRSWADYLCQVAGLSKVHASRLIRAAEVLDVIGRGQPIGCPPRPLPRTESQARPLLAIEDPGKQVLAWDKALDLASGDRQPSAKEVAKVVAMILEEQDMPVEPAPAPPKQTRAERRADVFARLKTVVGKRKDWDQAAELILELEDLL